MGKKIYWVTGPKNKLDTGVGLYSKYLIEGFDVPGVTLKKIVIPFDARTILRYVYQYLYLPFYLLFSVKEDDCVILYEESYAFLNLIKKIKNVDVILIFHHLYKGNKNLSFIERCKNLSLRLNLKLSDMSNVIIFPSECSKRDFETVVTKFSGDKWIIPNSFNFKKDSDVSYLLEHGGRKESNECKLLYVGTDEARKNLVTFIEALGLLKNKNKFSLTIIGKSIVEKTRFKIVEELQLNKVNYLIKDCVTDEELKFYYSEADVFIAPSTLEGFGRTPIEAQNFRCIVLASDIGIFRETMQDTALFIEKPLDKYNWAAKLEHIIFNYKNYNKMVERGVNNSLKYKKEVICRKFNKKIKMFVGK